MSWAGTLWISSYWAHPVALGSFPAGELAWMVISPAAWFVLIGSGAASARSLELTPKIQRLVVLLCGVAVTAMVVFLAGAVLWVFSDRQRTSEPVRCRRDRLRDCRDSRGRLDRDDTSLESGGSHRPEPGRSLIR